MAMISSMTRMKVESGLSAASLAMRRSGPLARAKLARPTIGDCRPESFYEVLIGVGRVQLDHSKVATVHFAPLSDALGYVCLPGPREILGE